MGIDGAFIAIKAGRGRTMQISCASLLAITIARATIM
jgi:hypothetical protein